MPAATARSRKSIFMSSPFPRHVQVELETARLISSNIAHAGDTITVEATVRPWQQPARQYSHSPIQLPARLPVGNLRLLISDAATLDRTLNQPRLPTTHRLGSGPGASSPATRRRPDLCQPAGARGPGRHGRANPLKPAAFHGQCSGTAAHRRDVNLNGESAQVAGEASTGGVLSGFRFSPCARTGWRFRLARVEAELCQWRSRIFLHSAGHNGYFAIQ